MIWNKWLLWRNNQLVNTIGPSTFQMFRSVFNFYSMHTNTVSRAVMRLRSYAICACTSRQPFYRYKYSMMIRVVLSTAMYVCSKSALTNVMQCIRRSDQGHNFAWFGPCGLYSFLKIAPLTTDWLSGPVSVFI